MAQETVSSTVVIIDYRDGAVFVDKQEIAVNVALALALWASEVESVIVPKVREWGGPVEQLSFLEPGRGEVPVKVAWQADIVVVLKKILRVAVPEFVIVLLIAGGEDLADGLGEFFRRGHFLKMIVWFVWGLCLRRRKDAWLYVKIKP